MSLRADKNLYYNNFSTTPSKQDLDWRGRLDLQHIKLSLTKQVFDVIQASADDLGPSSLDSFRKKNLPAPWKFVKEERLANSDTNKEGNEPIQIAAYVKTEISRGKQDDLVNDDHSQLLDTPAILARRQLREKRREKRAAVLVKQDDEVTVKLENAALEHSKAVDSAMLGKYSIWRKENEGKVCLAISDADLTRRYQIFFFDVWILDRCPFVPIRIGKVKSFTLLCSNSANQKIKSMDQVLSKVKEQFYDCKLVTEKLRAILQSADEQVRSLKRQSTFLSQLAAKTIPNGIHCLSMHLAIDYYLLPPEKREFPRSENLENPSLFHYALFSDIVLAASVVVNSTIMNAKEPEKHVFHLVTDKLNFGAMNMWFLLNPPGKATIHVENVDEFKWLNSSYCPVLRQLESAAMKEYYFKGAHSTTLSAGSSNLKYRNPKYLSMLNHLRFYLPQIYPIIG
ncbi:hypothetical protein P3S68_026110 [Capsicum galapagoense]